MIHLLVIADDMTGAIELGAFFAARHTAALVQAASRFPSDDTLADTAVLVLDTESRHLPANEAAGRVKHLAEAAQTRRIPYIYKKTDSVLRGNIAAELGALASVFPGQPLVYLPAYPAMGRTCRNGRLFLHGKPVSETAFSQDPLNPVTDNSVVNLFRRAGRPVLSIPDAQSLHAALNNPSPDTIFVCDAENDQDLLAFAQVLESLDRLHLLAGPGGFAEVLAGRLALPQIPPAPLPAAATTLTVCGSFNEVSLRQTELARQHGFRLIDLPPAPETWSEMAHELTRTLADSRHLILRLADSRDTLAHYWQYTEKLGIEKLTAARHLIDNLSKLVHTILKLNPPEALIVFGGDTAAGLVGAAPIRPLGELLPAVPFSRVELDGRSLCLITKPGSFGPPDILPVIRDILNRPSN